jgi:hypothetical protein
MNRGLVLAEWHRVRQALRAAQLLNKLGFPDDSVSRAYYAVLHAAKAALYVHDISVNSHAAARRMFGLHLVRPGRIEREWASSLGESLDDRLAADYQSDVWTSDEEARDEARRARRFLARIREYLLANGLTERELRKRLRHG